MAGDSGAGDVGASAGVVAGAGGAVGDSGVAGDSGAVGVGAGGAAGAGADTVAGGADTVAGGEDTVSGAAASDAVEYADFTLPEGMAVNPELLGEFKSTLAGLKLTQEQAQLVADLGVRQAQSILAQVAEGRQAEQSALAEAFNTGEGAVPNTGFVQPPVILAQMEKWESAVKADPVLGGDNLPQTLAVAMRAVEALGSPELKQLFDKSGIGSHPEVLRAFFNAGKLLGEDALVAGSNKPARAATGRTAFEQQANVLFG